MSSALNSVVQEEHLAEVDHGQRRTVSTGRVEQPRRVVGGKRIWLGPDRRTKNAAWRLFELIWPSMFRRTFTADGSAPRSPVVTTRSRSPSLSMSTAVSDVGPSPCRPFFVECRLVRAPSVPEDRNGGGVVVRYGEIRQTVPVKVSCGHAARHRDRLRPHAWLIPRKLARTAILHDDELPSIQSFCQFPKFVTTRSGGPSP